MIELDALQAVAQQFLALTDDLLCAAEQERWDAFIDMQQARDLQMAILVQEAGDALLNRLPQLRGRVTQALEKNLRCEELARACRDEMGETLSSVQHQRQLRSTYR